MLELWKWRAWRWQRRGGARRRGPRRPVQTLEEPRLAQAPVSLGQVARYGFVADPDGNWIEISARTSLTGIAPK